MTWDWPPSGNHKTDKLDISHAEEDSQRRPSANMNYDRIWETCRTPTVKMVEQWGCVLNIRHEKSWGNLFWYIIVCKRHLTRSGMNMVPATDSGQIVCKYEDDLLPAWRGVIIHFNYHGFTTSVFVIALFKQLDTYSDTYPQFNKS